MIYFGYIREKLTVKGKKLLELFKLVGIFIFAAVALGFFASIGIWAAVSFLRLFGIETL